LSSRISPFNLLPISHIPNTKVPFRGLNLKGFFLLISSFDGCVYWILFRYEFFELKKSLHEINIWKLTEAQLQNEPLIFK
jgi:hypothetical protein